MKHIKHKIALATAISTLFISVSAFSQDSVDDLMSLLTNMGKEKNLPVDLALKQFTDQDASRIQEWLDQIKKDQSTKTELPNPVMQGFGCVKNCSNRTGYVDVIINE